MAGRRKLERQIAQYAKELEYFRSHPGSASQHKPNQTGYLFSPATQAPNPIWSGNEVSLTPLPPPPNACSFDMGIYGVMGTLIVPAIAPQSPCTGMNTSKSLEVWWIGLGGDSTVTGYEGHVDDTLYQVGIEGQVECKLHRKNPLVSYWAFQEWLTWNVSGEQKIVPIPKFDDLINAGDSVSLSLQLAANGGFTFKITDGALSYSPPKPLEGAPDDPPQNTAEFVAERLDAGPDSEGNAQDYALPAPQPNPQPSAFTSEYVEGYSDFSDGITEYSFDDALPLNQSQTDTNACQHADAFCFTASNPSLTQNECDTQAGLATDGKTGGFSYTNLGNPDPDGYCLEE